MASWRLVTLYRITMSAAVFSSSWNEVQLETCGALLFLGILNNLDVTLYDYRVALYRFIYMYYSAVELMMAVGCK